MQIFHLVRSKNFAIFLTELFSIIRWVYRRYFIKPYSYLRKILLANFPFVAPAINISDPGNEFDYFIFGVIDWHFRFQRPQQLAKSLSSRGRRVFYISSNFCNDRRGGFDLESLDSEERLFQVKLYC